MSSHISYHPLGTDTIRRYVGYLSSQDPAALAGIEYDAAGAHDRFRPAFVAMASSAQTLVGGFDATHGLNLAATQGFFGHFHYIHDARLSSIGALLASYTETWHELLPTWPATERAENRLGDEPSSGVFIAAERVGQFMNDAHSEPALQAALAHEFPGEKLQVLWAALTEAYESGFALLEASGVIEPDPVDISKSACRTNQTNCDPAGLRLYLAAASPPVPPAPVPPAPEAAAPPPPALAPPAPAQQSAPAAAPRPPAPQSPPPPIADPSTVGQMEWEPAVVLLGNAHDCRRELVFGPGGFLEAWDEHRGLMNLVHPATGLGIALWFDWKEDFLLEQRCREIADWRIGWPDEDVGRMAELQFSWDGTGPGGHVDEGLQAFDHWLQERGQGMRLVAVETYGDFYVSFLYPEADAYYFIEALGNAGVEAKMQDGSIPARPRGAEHAGPPPGTGAPVAPAPARKMPDAPSLAERMRNRASNPEPPSDF